MAGVRFTNSYYSKTGTLWRIDIYDPDFSGTATEFKTKYDSVVTDWKNQGANPYNEIMGSEFSFSMMLEDATTFAFYTDLISKPENYYTVAHYREGVLDWCGLIQADNTTILDIDFPQPYQIRAVDGIGLLKDIDYKDVSDIYTGNESFVGHILNCINKLPHIGTYYGSSTIVLKVAVDWWETSMTNSSVNDPFKLSGVNHGVFWSLADNDADKFKNCLEVIKSICVSWGARIKYMDGCFWIEQLSVLDASGYYVRPYYKSGTATTTQSYSSKITVSSAGTKRFEGAEYDRLPSLKKVTITEHVYERRNLFATLNLQNISNPVKNEIKSNNGKATLRLLLKINGILQQLVLSGSPVYVGAFILFRIKLRLGPSPGKTLKRNLKQLTNFVATYEDTVWDPTGAGYYYFHTVMQPIPIFGEYTSFEASIDVQTPVYYADYDEQAIAAIEYVGTIDGSTGLSYSNYSATFGLSGTPYMEVYSEGYPKPDEIDELRYSATNSDTKSLAKLEGITYFGSSQSANSVGRLKRWNGSAWVDALLWGAGTDTPNKQLSDLSCLVKLQSQYLPKEKFRASIYGFGSASPNNRLFHRSKTWGFIGGSHRHELSEIQGEWYVIQYDAGGVSNTPVKIKKKNNLINNDTPVTDSPIKGGGGGGGGGSNSPVSPFSDHPPAMLFPLKNNTTSSPLLVGAITSIPVVTALTGSDYAAGDIITIVDPYTGASNDLTLTAAATAGGTAMAVSGTLTSNYPLGAYLIKKPIAYAFNLPATTKGSVLRYNTGTNKWEAYDGTGDGYVIAWNASTNNWEQQQIVLTGDVTGTRTTSAFATTIANQAVSNAKFRNSAGLSVVGRSANSAGSVADITAVTTNQVLVIDPSTTAVTWGAVNLAAAAAVTGTLGVGNGGTSFNTFTTGQMLYSSAANTLAKLNIGSTGQVLTVSGGIPAWATPVNQTITLTGDVTGSGTASIAATIANNAVTLAKMAQVATSTILGRVTAGTGNVEALTGTQATTLLNTFTSTLKGLAPASGGGTVNFLRADGTWAAPTASIGPGITGAVTFWSSTSAITASSKLTYTESGLLQFSAVHTVAGQNSVLQIGHSDNTSTGSNAYLEIYSGGGSGGDAYVSYIVNTVSTFVAGVDNSDGDKFKITPGASQPGGTGNKGLIITNAATPLIGINKDAPAHPLDVAGRARADLLMCNTATITSAFGTGAGTGATIQPITGGNNAISVTFTAGTSPAAGGIVLTLTLANSFPVNTIPIFGGNDTASAQLIANGSIYCASVTGSQIKIQMATGVTLPAGTYTFNIHILGT